jgi:hypothetical protein
MRRCRFQPAPHLGTGSKPSLLKNRPSTSQNHEIRDRLHPEPRGNLRAILGVNLQDQGLPSHISRELMYLSRRHPAGTAPCGPEVGQNGNFGSGDNFSECAFIDVERLVDGR